MNGKYNSKVQLKFDKFVEITEKYGVRVIYNRTVSHNRNNSVSFDDFFDVRLKDDWVSSRIYIGYNYGGYGEPKPVSFCPICNIQEEELSEKETKILCEYWLRLHQICKELTALKISSTYMMLESDNIEEGYGYSPLEYFKRAYSKINKRLTYHEEYR